MANQNFYNPYLTPPLSGPGRGAASTPGPYRPTPGPTQPGFGASSADRGAFNNTTGPVTIGGNGYPAQDMTPDEAARVYNPSMDNSPFARPAIGGRGKGGPGFGGYGGGQQWWMNPNASLPTNAQDAFNLYYQNSGVPTWRQKQLEQQQRPGFTMGQGMPGIRY